MKLIKITNRHLMFTQFIKEWGCDLNLGLILGEHRNYVIDTGLGENSVLPAIEHLQKDKPTVVINTHFHWDHIWANHMFAHCPIISHRLCREHLDLYWEKAFEHNKAKADGNVVKCLPNLTFDGEMFFPDDGLALFHSPGHSHDSISIYDAVDKVLYVGDEIGDTDEKIIPEIATNHATLRSTLEIWKKLDFEIAISGHNKPQDKGVIERMEAELERLGH
ncbi:MAG: MBL fold metallo-hydrolase [Defluviitaleaceae bacterium]|nr:MBL fold metallo-hydrolase [Defluviitaleaceae bacterium]